MYMSQGVNMNTTTGGGLGAGLKRALTGLHVRRQRWAVWYRRTRDRLSQQDRPTELAGIWWEDSLPAGRAALCVAHGRHRHRVHEEAHDGLLWGRGVCPPGTHGYGRRHGEGGRDIDQEGSEGGRGAEDLVRVPCGLPGRGGVRHKNARWVQERALRRGGFVRVGPPGARDRLVARPATPADDIGDRTPCPQRRGDRPGSAHPWHGGWRRWRGWGGR